MRVFITGIAGFIGSHLAERLVNQGHSVAGIDNLTFGNRQNVPDGVLHYKTQDVLTLKGYDLDFFKPDVVVHLAAISCSRHPNDALVWQNNLWATAHLLSAAKNYKIVFASTCLATKPESGAYADSKRACEQITRPEGAVMLRLANVYGERQRDWGTEPSAMAAWRRAEAEGQPIKIHGDGTQTRDFIHVDDVVRAFEAAIERADSLGKHVAPIDICTGRQVSMLDVADLFDGERIFTERPPGDPDETTQDPARARDLLGFEAQIELFESMEAT